MITCEYSGKLYIGSAVNIARRWSEHKRDLRLNKHPSKHLQNSWNKYGEDMFKFTVIEEVNDVNELINKEQYWIDVYQSFNRAYGFNVCAVAGSRLGVKHSEESISKMSMSKKGKKGGPRSVETREKQSQAKAKNWIVISPEGVIFRVNNLNSFCKKNSLSSGNMVAVAKGRHKHHKGWRCKYV